MSWNQSLDARDEQALCAECAKVGDRAVDRRGGDDRMHRNEASAVEHVDDGRTIQAGKNAAYVLQLVGRHVRHEITLTARTQRGIWTDDEGIAAIL